MNLFHYWSFNTVWYFTSFNDHTYFNNSVFLLWCLSLKYILWFRKRSSKVVAASLKYVFVSSLISFSASALYIKFEFWHWLWRGQVFFTQQLRRCLVILAWSNDLLCPTICDDILLMQLYLIFTLFLLKIMCNLFSQNVSLANLKISYINRIR